MGLGSPDNHVIYRTSSVDTDGATLVLQHVNGLYTVYWDDNVCIDADSITMDELVDVLARTGAMALPVIELKEFICGYIGEERWALAVLETL